MKTLDFTSVPKREVLPEGMYVVTVKKVEEKVSSKGSDMWLVSFEEAESKNYLFENYVLQANCMWKLQELLGAIGYDVDGTLDVEPSELVGAVLNAKVIQDTYDGNIVNRIKKDLRNVISVQLAVQRAYTLWALYDLILRTRRNLVQDFYEQFVTFEKQTGAQKYAKCPMHDDSTASFTVNVDTDEWYCHGCGVGGRYAEFIENYFDVGLPIAIKAAKLWESKGKLPFPTQEYVEKCQAALQTRANEVKVLNGFGITDETIEKMKIGWDDTRITIPVVSRTGLLVNVRKYLPPHRRIQGSNNAKCLSVQLCGESRFYPYDAFTDDEEHKTVWIVEGEKDCLAARSQGLNAVTGTGGVNLPLREMNMFRDKIVYVMVDNDPAGSRIAKQYIQSLKSIAQELHHVVLPVKDFSEYWEQYQNADVLQYAKPADIVVKGPKENMDESTSLSKSEYVENLNTWISLEEMCVIGADPKTYTIPSKLKVICGDPSCKNPCQIGNAKEAETVDVDPRQLLQFIDSSDDYQDRYLRKMFGCKSIISEPAEYVNIQKLIFQETASFMSGLDDSSFEPRYGVFYVRREQVNSYRQI